jgi:hypothetical protein
LSVGKTPAQDLFEAVQGDRLGVVGGDDGVADLGVGDLLDVGDEVADLAGAEVGVALDVGGEGADVDDVEVLAGGHHADLVAGAQDPGEHADDRDDALVAVPPRVDDEGLDLGVAVAAGRRDAQDDGLDQLGDADAGLGGDQQGLGGVEADGLLDLGLDAGDIGGRQVDLVDDRDDLEVGVEREVDVGEGLGLDALGGVDHQQDALAGGEAARDLVAEVDVAGGVDQVEGVLDPLVGVLHAYSLGLDRDAPLLLDVHAIEVLGGLVTRGEQAGELHQSIGERALAVIDVGDDAEAADQGLFGGRRVRQARGRVNHARSRRAPEKGPAHVAQERLAWRSRARSTVTSGAGADAGPVRSLLPAGGFA